MQLICNGVSLDLYESENLRLVKKNPLFAFDELSAERSSQFKVPSTPTNDRVFKLSKRPDFYGEGMRQRYKCQLQAGAVVQNGYLYVSSFDGKDYQCIMLVGMLFDIKTFGVHEWGSLRFGGLRLRNGSIDANSPDVKIIDTPRYYLQGSQEPTPSVDVGALFHMLNDQGLLPISGMDDSIKLRLLPKTAAEWGVREQLTDIAETLINENPTEHRMGVTSSENIIEASDSTIRVWIEDNPEPDIEYMRGFHFPGNTCSITFPEDTPQNLCICCVGEPSIATQGGFYYAVRFVGDRGFMRPATPEGQVEYYGEPLAGRTIELDVNDTSGFLLLTGAGLPYDQYYGQQVFSFNDFDFTREPNYSLDVRVTGRWFSGQGVPVNYILKDLSLGQLIKQYMAVSGKLIGLQSDGKYAFFDDIDPKIIEPEIIKISAISRKFGNYAQRNYIRFADDKDNMLPDEATQMEYLLQNVNLEEEKTIEKLEAVEGGIYRDSELSDEENIENNLLELRGAEYNAEQTGFELASDALAEISDFTHMKRATLRKSELLQRLCEASTQIKIDARMPFFQYNKIDSDTALLVHNTLYTWTESQWQKNVAQLTLAKIKPAPFIPEEYQRVEWIRGTGRPRINTGISFDKTTRFTAVMMMKDGLYYPDRTYFGNRQYPFIDSYFSGLDMQMSWQGIRKRISLYPNIKATVSLSATEFRINNTVETFDASSLNFANVPILIFYIDDSRFYCGNFYLYRFQIEKGGELVRDLIPCYRKSDNVIGMFDRVQKVFITNSGSGTFDVGQDID